MTEEQKDILIAKMLEAPASLTAKELDAIMCDAELREIYDVSAAIGNACIRQPEIDVAHEWLRFSQRMHPRRKSVSRKLMMVASIALALLTMMGVMYFPLRYMQKDSKTPLIARAEPHQPATVPDTASDDTTAFTGSETGESSEPEADEGDVRTLTRQADEADIDEYLRLQQARVDNELALQNAEMFRLEYAELLDVLTSNGEDTTVLHEDLNRLTMQ